MRRKGGIYVQYSLAWNRYSIIWGMKMANFRHHNKLHVKLTDLLDES